MDRVKQEIAKALQLQKEIYGDFLYTTLLKNISPAEEKAAFNLKSNSEEKAPSNTNNYSPGKTSKFIVLEPEEKKISSIEEAAGIPEFRNAKDIAELNSMICNCLLCPLGKTRKTFVFGSGNPNADVLVVGEGPGEQEDNTGLPFVGRAGQLLTDILAAIKFSREEVYIANIVKCRPPGNRAPFAEEMEKCIPYLKKQIEVINPKVILCLGLTAAQGLLKKKDTLTNLRGNVYDFEGRKVMITYHPAALLRNPNWKRGCWEDVQKFRNLHDSIVKN